MREERECECVLCEKKLKLLCIHVVKDFTFTCVTFFVVLASYIHSTGSCDRIRYWHFTDNIGFWTVYNT